jgi:hypothetical protein
MAYASGGNSKDLVSIDSVTLSSDGKNLIYTVSLTTYSGAKHGQFIMLVFYGDSPLDPSHVGTLFYYGAHVFNLQDQGNGKMYGQLTFVVPLQGKGTHYYLSILKGFDADKGTLLGSAWIDPREGTTP